MSAPSSLGNACADQRQKGTTTSWDLAILVVIIMLAVLMATCFNFFERFEQLLIPSTTWGEQLDEILVALVVILCALGVFSWRRWKEMMAELAMRKQVEGALEQARNAAVESTQLKSAFLATMSHEIRTPMNGVIGMTDLLLDTALSPEQRDCAETIRSSGEALLTVINDILDFSKIEAGKLQFETREFDLHTAVEGTVELLAVPAQAKGLELTALIAREVPSGVRGDPGRFRQVLTNLLGNAVKFTAQGEVAVRVLPERETDTHVVIRCTITDTGIGIPAESQGQLFQPFVQADGATMRLYGGTGLGLAIAKQLVTSMGGTIGVDSALGHGAMFWFTACFEKQTTPAKAIASPEVGRFAGVRVLVVDDHETNRTVVQYHVTAWGMHSTQVASGPEALIEVRRAATTGCPYALALLDMHMPKMNGVQVAQAIKGDPAMASTVLVLLVPRGQLDTWESLRAAGIAACLTKPVTPSRLFDCVATVLTPQASPARAAPARRPVEPADAPALASPVPPAQVGHILLVEDNVVNQKVAVRLVQKLGYAVEVAANGIEAIEALQHRCYDLVLMDCLMPEMDGYQATIAIRRDAPRAPRLPIIAMTANALQGDREKCLAAGMDDYLSKPLNAEDLRAVIARWSKPPQDAETVCA